MSKPKCRLCGQLTLPKGVVKKPDHYDHAGNCPNAAPSGAKCIGLGHKLCSCPPCWEARTR